MLPPELDPAYFWPGSFVSGDVIDASMLPGASFSREVKALQWHVSTRTHLSVLTSVAVCVFCGTCGQMHIIVGEIGVKDVERADSPFSPFARGSYRGR